MYKLSVLFFSIVTIQALNAKVFYKPASFTDRQQHLYQPKGLKFTHSSDQYIGNDFPVDQGGNWGDIIHLNREENDTLVFREIIINEDISDTDTEFKFKHDEVDGMNITTARAINLGRERAFVSMIVTSDRGLVLVNGLIKHNQQMRLLVEAYGKPVEDSSL